MGLRHPVLKIQSFSDKLVHKQFNRRNYEIHVRFAAVGKQAKGRLAGQENGVCCRVLQCVAVCCSVLQCVAVCCSVL